MQNVNIYKHYNVKGNNIKYVDIYSKYSENLAVNKIVLGYASRKDMIYSYMNERKNNKVFCGEGSKQLDIETLLFLKQLFNDCQISSAIFADYLERCDDKVLKLKN